MIKFLKSRFCNEDGAVTVDWIVLTAAMVGLAVGAITSAKIGIVSLTERTMSSVEDLAEN